MNKINLTIVLSILISVICFNGVYALNVLESLGTTTVNEEYQFVQVCANANFINLSSINTPSGNIILNIPMTSTGSGQFVYNYTPTELGRYDFIGISDGCEKTFATYVNVTSNGTSNNNIIVIVLFAVGLLLIICGVQYDYHPIVYLGSVGMALSGIYTTIYGFANDTSMYSRGLGIILIGLSVIIMMVSAYRDVSDGDDSSSSSDETDETDYFNKKEDD